MHLDRSFTGARSRLFRLHICGHPGQNCHVRNHTREFHIQIYLLLPCNQVDSTSRY